MEYDQNVGWQSFYDQDFSSAQFNRELDEQISLTAMVGVQPEMDITLYNNDAAKTTIISRLYLEGNLVISTDQGSTRDECFAMGIKAAGNFELNLFDLVNTNFEEIFFDEKIALVGDLECLDNFLKGYWKYSNGAIAYYDGLGTNAKGTEVPDDNEGYNFVIGENYWQNLQQTSDSTWVLDHILRSNNGSVMYNSATFTKVDDNSIRSQISGFGTEILKRGF
jgi:hypothetical protein